MSKIISSDEAYKRWAQPDVGHQPKKAEKVEKPVDLQKELEKEIAALKEAARQEGFEQGRSEGLAKTRAEVDLYTGRFMALIDAFASPLDQLGDEVEDELVKLSVAIAKQIVRRELKTDPAQVIGVVKEALSALPAASMNIKLHLHPDDAKLVSEIMLTNVSERKWELVENPVMQRGGCRIETDSASVDASIESRVATIAARIMGGERSNDS